MYAPWNVTTKRENRRAFAGRISGLVPIQGGNRIRGSVGKEHRAANVGGDDIVHDLVAPRVLQTCDALGGDLEAPRENRVSG